MLKWFFFSNLFPSPKKYQKYDLILTKKYINKRGLTQGGLVLRIEYMIEDNYLCSKGSFQIIENRIEWVIKEDSKLIPISLSNIEKTLSVKEAQNVLAENIKNK